MLNHVCFMSFAFVDVRTGYRQGQVSKLFEYFNLHPRGTSKNNTEPLDLISLMPHSRPSKNAHLNRHIHIPRQVEDRETDDFVAAAADAGACLPL